jgi:hypothetical protein
MHSAGGTEVKIKRVSLNIRPSINMPARSLKLSSPWGGGIACSAGVGSPTFCDIRGLITYPLVPSRLCLEAVKSNAHNTHTVLLKSILILDSHTALVFQVALSLKASRLKFYMHYYPPMRATCPAIIVVVVMIVLFRVKSTNYRACY